MRPDYLLVVNRSDDETYHFTDYWTAFVNAMEVLKDPEVRTVELYERRNQWKKEQHDAHPADAG